MKASRILTGEPVCHKAAQGRVCAAPGCGTILSVYNTSPFCSLHDDTEELPVPDGYCRCRSCGRVLPWTAEFFHRDGSRRSREFQRACKTCRNHHNRTTTLHAPSRVEKRCPHCGKTKVLNANYWYPNPSNRDGFGSWCKVCHRDSARERERARAAARRAAP